MNLGKSGKSDLHLIRRKSSKQSSMLLLSRSKSRVRLFVLLMLKFHRVGALQNRDGSTTSSNFRLFLPLGVCCTARKHSEGLDHLRVGACV